MAPKSRKSVYPQGPNTIERSIEDILLDDQLVEKLDGVSLEHNDKEQNFLTRKKRVIKKLPRKTGQRLTPETRIHLLDDCNPYNIAACHEWFSNYHGRLPRELRDTIFALVVSPHERELRLPKCLNEFPFHHEEPKHILKPEIVGTRYLTEINELLYEDSTFTASQPEAISAFLSVDTLHSYLKPLDLVREVVLRYNLEDDSGYEFKPDEFSFVRKMRCKNALTIVFFSKDNSFDSNFPKPFQGFLENLAPWVFEHKELGYTVCVKGVWKEGDEPVEVNIRPRMGNSLDEFQTWRRTWS